MSPLTVQDLLTHLEAIRRHFGGQVPAWLQASCAPLACARCGHPGPALDLIRPVATAATHHGPQGFVALVLQGPEPGARAASTADAAVRAARLPAAGEPQGGGHSQEKETRTR